MKLDHQGSTGAPRRTVRRTHIEARPGQTPHAGARPCSARDAARFLANEVLHSIQSALPGAAGVDDEVMLERERAGYRVVILRQRAPLPAPPNLSPRELEIARMIAKGYPNKTIAAVLEISSWTVGTHLRRIFAKFGVNSRAAMVGRLMESGLLRTPSHLDETKIATSPPGSRRS